MALEGNSGFLYFASLSTADTTAPALTGASWYKIMGKGSTGSLLPTNLSSGDVFYQRTSASPVTTAAFSSNDAVRNFTLTTAAFVTDISNTASKEKFDQTVQTDAVRSYQVSEKPEASGSINGYWIQNNTKQQDVLKKFRTVLEQSTSDAITKTTPQTSVIHMFLSREESTAQTAQIWEYKPVILDSYNSDKPLEGPQTFSFNYTENGADKPSIIILDN